MAVMASPSPNRLPFPASPSHSNGHSSPAGGSESWTHSGYDSPSTSQAADSSNLQVSRTICILMKSAAKVHRLAVQSRLQLAGFEIIAEREEIWHTPEDDDFLEEFLLAEADVRKQKNRLTGGPIYVQVLERRRAAQTLIDLIGEDSASGLDEDGVPLPKNTLRSTYGNDAFWCPQPAAAERLIAICFAELAKEGAYVSSLPPSEGHSVLVDSDDIEYDEHGNAFSARTGEALALEEDVTGSAATSSRDYGQRQSSKVFRARPLPASIAKPSIQPRLSRAAALRMGVELPVVPRKSSATATSQSSGSVGISGKPKSAVPIPRSLAQPSIVPRLNKAAAARTGQASPEATRTTQAKDRKAVDFSSTPGHKRASATIKVASLAAPTLVPRANRASAARMGGDSATSPSTSGPRAPAPRASSQSPERTRKPVDFSSTPGHKRASTGLNLSSLAAPSIVPRTNRAAAARMSISGDGSAPSTLSRAASKPSAASGSADRARKPVDFSNTPGHRRLSVGSANIPSLQAPVIQPRLNAAANARLTSRPSSSLGNYPARPASRTGSEYGSNPHQDGSNPTKKKNQAPPSSYRHTSSQSVQLPPRPLSRA